MYHLRSGSLMPQCRAVPAKPSHFIVLKYVYYLTYYTYEDFFTLEQHIFLPNVKKTFFSEKGCELLNTYANLALIVFLHNFVYRRIN